MNKFVATCLESRLALYDARTQHPADGFAGSCEALAGRDATLWGVHHLPQVRRAAWAAQQGRPAMRCPSPAAGTAAAASQSMPAAEAAPPHWRAPGPPHPPTHPYPYNRTEMCSW